MALRSGRLWLIAGTGEGPRLARHFLERGWRLRVSVVSPSAALPFPADSRLELVVGALEGAAALRQLLAAAEAEGDPFQWVIDASHPFAMRITEAVVAATDQRPEGLLRLQRPCLASPMAIPLGHMAELAAHVQTSHRLLLAIGARHLGAAASQCGGATLHARVLPHPQALRQAQQAGLDPRRIACCRPSADGAVEEALCRLWQIDTVVCRQSGGITEALWLKITARLGLRLLLLLRPREPEGILQLPFQELVQHVGRPQQALDRGR